MKKLLGILILGLALVPAAVLAEYMVGEHVENFTLPDTSGNMVSLYDYSDRIVCMVFWDIP